MNQRGSVLLQVLMIAVVAGIISASILRARLQPSMTAANTVQRVQNEAAEQGAIDRVQQVWMAGGACSTDATAGVSCAGSGCSCTCTVAGLGTVTSVANGGACSLTAASP